ncbi:lytic polysaccharide monooxygenase [Micromonospora haikouensis]|uniref:lytic polysaccharide monooxygenase auxiliary activity family 9 protein n=1 Tax=Micromonospora haikouensis TaxID=686309 RepID=UPI0034161E94
MAVRRMFAAVAVAAATVALAAPPAYAHGAPTDPLSRAAACRPGGPHAATPACRAAVSAGAAVREWDNIRVARIDGRDRQRIPDGELCSGGLSAYQGLDLARSDWPATELTAGAKFTFRYRTTIPHRGTFRLYSTVDDYDPKRRLTWVDLETEPFLTATDPPIRDGAYQMTGRLPAGRSGRHLIYTIWQNSDTQDTYYSCSDVIYRDGAGPGGGPAGGKPAPTAVAPAGESEPAAAPEVLAADAGTLGAPAGDTVGGAPGVPVASVSRLGPGGWPVAAGAAVALVVLLAALVVRLRRPAAPPPGRPCGVRNHRAGRRRIW